VHVPPKGLTSLTRRELVGFGSALTLCPLPFGFDSALAKGETSLYDFTVMRNGEPFSLDQFRGKVTVVLNVASE